MNRGIYQNAVLHDPTNDPAPTPFTPPPAWNRRLIAHPWRRLPERLVPPGRRAWASTR